MSKVVKKTRYEPNVKLKALRELRGMSQESLAFKMGDGVRGFTVSGWEIGITRMTLGQARKAAFHLRAGKVSDVIMVEQEPSAAEVNT